MTTLIEFLEARLAKDEETARAAKEAPVGWGETDQSWDDMMDKPWRYWDQDEVVEFISAHSPARVLREVAAKRAILRDHLEDHAPEHDCIQHVNSLDAKYSGCYAAVQLASVQSDHPDLDPNWSTT